MTWYAVIVVTIPFLLGAGLVLALLYSDVKKARRYDEWSKFVKKRIRQSDFEHKPKSVSGCCGASFTTSKFKDASSRTLFTCDQCGGRERFVMTESERLGEVSDVQELRRQWSGRAQSLNDMSIEARADR